MKMFQWCADWLQKAPKPLQEAATALGRELEALGGIEAHVRFAHDLIEMFKEKFPTIQCGVNRYGPWVDVHIHDINDFVDVVPIHRYIRRTYAGLPKVIDHPSVSQREYVYDAGKFRLHTYLKTGATCKYVQVGTKEVPVHELRCNGALAAPQRELKNPPELTAVA